MCGLLAEDGGEGAEAAREILVGIAFLEGEGGESFGRMLEAAPGWFDAQDGVSVLRKSRRKCAISGSDVDKAKIWRADQPSLEDIPDGRQQDRVRRYGVCRTPRILSHAGLLPAGIL